MMNDTTVMRSILIKALITGALSYVLLVGGQHSIAKDIKVVPSAPNPVASTQAQQTETDFEIIQKTRKNEKSVNISGYYYGALSAPQLQTLIDKGDPKALFDQALKAYSEQDETRYPEIFKGAQLAADAYLLRAQYLLGVFYDKGIGTPQDFRQAAHWYTLAARGGYVDAQYNLAGLYIAGRGVEKDWISALSWLWIAKARGDSASEQSIKILEAQMDKDTIHQARSIAKHWEVGGKI